MVEWWADGSLFLFLVPTWFIFTDPGPYLFLLILVPTWFIFTDSGLYTQILSAWGKADAEYSLNKRQIESELVPGKTINFMIQI